jgi:serine protease Do
MHCRCGHREQDHVGGGRCRVPDCPCETFQPGDTLRGTASAGGPRAGAGWRAGSLLGALAYVVGLWLALPGPAAAQGVAPPASFARVAAVARAATIVVRTSDVDGRVGGLADDGGPDVGPFDEESELSEPLAEREDRTLASGVVVDPRGFALTSARAVLLVQRFTVFLVDGTPVKATLVAVDLRTDVAVLKLDNGGVAMSHLPFGDSARVAVGDWVITVGAPMGLEGTVTAGVVTAMPAPAAPSPLAGFMQTDASMGMGNAGGPVVSLRGELVGLSTLLSGNGIGYVRPSSSVRTVYLALLEKGRVSRPWLGVTTQALTPELAQALRVGQRAGVLLADVNPEGPAAAAGLRSGDVVLALDGTAVSSRADVDRMITARTPGRVMTVSVRRAAAELKLTVRLAEEPGDWPLPSEVARARRLLGIEARPITPTMGVRAASVDAISPAGRAGLVAGDVIREIDRWPIRTMADFQAALRSLDARRPVLVQIQRGEVAVYVALVPGDRND